MDPAQPLTLVPRRLSAQELAESGPPEAVRLPLDLIDPNPNNPRRELVEIDALADNILAFGLLQPVTVRRVGERYELIGGHRRRAAFALLRERMPHDIFWRTIPAVIRTADDNQAERMLISSQIHNRQWRPREEATALERLVVEGLTLKQIGATLNKTEAWASKRLRVYADAVLSGYVQSGRLATTTAEELLMLKEPAVRREYAERAIAENWSQQHARREVRKLRLDSQLRDIAKRANELAEVLGSIDPSRLPPDSAKTLWQLKGRIELLARGGQRLPTIAEAERAAGVKQTSRGQAKKPRRLRIPS